MKKRKIIIADDHAIVREGLKNIISAEENLLVLDDVETGQELIEHIRNKKYDIIILDITLPDRNGLEILKQLKGENVTTPVLILSMHSEDNYAIRAFRAGAAGYLTKRSAPKELIFAIEKLLDGGKYINAKFAEILINYIYDDQTTPLHNKLSDREIEIVEKIALGKSINEIAGELFLKASTISTYRRRILDKLNLKNNIELAKYAQESSLIE